MLLLSKDDNYVYSQDKKKQTSYVPVLTLPFICHITQIKDCITSLSLRLAFCKSLEYHALKYFSLVFNDESMILVLKFFFEQENVSKVGEGFFFKLAWQVFQWNPSLKCWLSKGITCCSSKPN